MTASSTASPRVALYARVSTSDQSTDGQIRDLTEYAARMGWLVSPELFFRDDGVSGIRSNRPQLDRLRAQVRDRGVDVVLAVKLDRLGRSVMGVLQFYEEAEAKGVRVICTSQGFDTETAAGRLIRDVLAAVGAFERELIVERTISGLRRARAQGKRLGRPPIQVSEGVKKRILELRDVQKLPWRQIAQHVRIPTSRVRRIHKGQSGLGDGGSPS